MFLVSEIMLCFCDVLDLFVVVVYNESSWWFICCLFYRYIEEVLMVLDFCDDVIREYMFGVLEVLC